MEKLVYVPSNKEIVAGTILVYCPTGEIIICKDLKDYLIYLDDRENHDMS
ncbi:MAG: hypothetical protein WC523_06570 [Patescibacteria group bacterium]|jgi:hypothetical protein